MARVPGFVLAAALALAAPAFADDAPTLRKLDGDPAPPPTAPSDAARPLPRTVAVCRNAATGRCWLAPNAAACGGPPFRVVIDDATHTDAEAALVACRATPQKPPAD